MRGQSVLRRLSHVQASCIHHGLSGCACFCSSSALCTGEGLTQGVENGRCGGSAVVAATGGHVTLTLMCEAVPHKPQHQNSWYAPSCAVDAHLRHKKERRRKPRSRQQMWQKQKLVELLPLDPNNVRHASRFRRSRRMTSLSCSR